MEDSAMHKKAEEVEREERRRNVAANLLSGMDYRDISEALEISLGTICNDVKVILGRWQRDQVQTFEHHLLMQLRQIDRAINAIWDKVLAGDLDAIDAFCKLADRKAKLLGLDKPLKLTIMPTEAELDAAIERELAALAAKSKGGVPEAPPDADAGAE